MSEVSLWLDTYDDLYSDFDPRPFGKRLVSLDFINELRRNTREFSSGPIQLALYVPDALRKNEWEKEIKASLENYFIRQLSSAEHSLRRIVQQGIIMMLTGIALLLIASFVMFKSYSGFLPTALLVILEPAGWFLLWNGLDNIFYESRDKKRDLNFFTKMQDCEIQFRSLAS